MSYAGSNQTQNPRNQGNYDRNQQSRRNEYNNAYPEKPYYVAKERHENNTNTQGGPEDKSEGNYNTQGNADPKVRKPYKDNKQGYDGNYENRTYDRTKNSYNQEETKGNEGQGESNQYHKRSEGQSRSDNYNRDYNQGNPPYRKYAGGQQTQHYNKRIPMENNHWQNTQHEGGYEPKRNLYNKKNYNQEEYKYTDKKPYNKHQNEETAGNQGETKEGNKGNGREYHSNTATADNKNTQQPNKTNQTPQPVTEQIKPAETQQKEDPTSQTVNKPTTAPASTTTQPVETKTENAGSQSQKAQTKPQVIQAQVMPTHFIQAPVSTEQNRFSYAPGMPQFVPIPPLFQTPYIVYPQPNGGSIVQQLFQVPGNNADTFSIPTNMIPSENKQILPQALGVPQFPQLQQVFQQGLMMGQQPMMMQPMMFMPTTGAQTSSNLEKQPKT